jgi:hypothetical protein
MILLSLPSFADTDYTKPAGSIGEFPTHHGSTGCPLNGFIALMPLQIADGSTEVRQGFGCVLAEH